MAQEHDLVMILARGLASSIATPLFLVDPEGTLIYYNEAAEGILGRSYAEAGALAASELSSIFHTTDPTTGKVIEAEDLPIGRALSQRSPAHAPLTITGLDGVERTIAVTAIPLFAQSDEFIGAMAVFWEDRS